MTVRELIAEVRDVVQDTDSTYFSDSEVLNVYNECKRYMSAERREETSNITVTMVDGVNEYTVNGAIRYINAKTQNGTYYNLYANDKTGDDDIGGIIILSYNTIYVNNPVDGDVITFRVVSSPTEDNLNDTIRAGDETSYKYYILSKLYEKDTDLEQFQKAQYFGNLFIGIFDKVKKNSAQNFVSSRESTAAYYF
jgi:hypothetical protein